MNKNDKKIQIYFFAAFFLAVIVLTVFIFLPFFLPLSIATVLAILCRSFYERVLRLTGGREGLSAFLTIIVVVFVVFVPLTIIGTTVFQEARELSMKISNRNEDGIGRFVGFVEERIALFFPGFSFNFSEYVRRGANWLVQNFGMIFAEVGRVLLGFFLSLMAFYYLLKDGKKLAYAVIALSPLPDTYDRKILTQLAAAIKSVIRSSLTIAIIQGILTGVGLALFGVPNPTLLGSIAAVAALVPGVGVGLVLLPAIIYLFIAGSIGSAVGLIVWGVVAVGLIDNVLGPRLIGREIPIHPFLILLSVIGGLGFFGPIGFLLGPLILSLLFALIEIYRILMWPGQEDSSSP